MKRNYNINEAAEFLRIPAKTVRLHQKEIGFSKLGRRIVFTEDDLTRWMESRRKEPVVEMNV